MQITANENDINDILQTFSICHWYVFIGRDFDYESI